ncbi:MAG: patatin-like phospholipase family protein, partial [Candidatus Marinimicrobia bacterium]|nr:patatin-like phospholipase family protein [Candidatus Neomarinimicrobiota bacterium]
SIRKGFGMKLICLSLVFLSAILFVGDVSNDTPTSLTFSKTHAPDENDKNMFAEPDNSVKLNFPGGFFHDHEGQNFKVGVALSGGAAKGLAHIGVLKALEEAGIRIDYIAGSSMGALIGAAYASGIPVDTLEKIAVDIDWKTAAKLFIPGFSTSGLIDGKRVKEFLYTFYGDKKIEDLPIPFAATAADISSGKLYVINKGSLLEAVRASISIPIVFTPVKHKDIFLVDGGLVDPVPIDVVREMGADFVIAVHVIHAGFSLEEKEYIEIINSDREKKKLPTLENLSRQIAEYLNKAEDKVKDTKPDEKSESPKITQISQNTLRIAQYVIANLQIELYKPDLVIEPDTRSISQYEFYRGKDAIEIGYKEAIKVLGTLK